jgi:enoyl-CoA hydratase/carnithine racemase
MTDRAPLRIEVKGAIAHLELDRPDKRNAVNDALIGAIEAFFAAPPAGVKVTVLSGAGRHFSAGLDLAEHVARTPFESVKHSRMWHRALDRVEFGGLPVVCAMQGAVIGGGLEIATATHVRVAEPSCIYALPEGRRGIYVGGGASVRVARLIGVGRMREMMLTGRQLDAEEGQRLGLSHYLVGGDEALAKAFHLAETIAGNAEMSNYMMIQALSRIGDMAAADGLFTESLASALTTTSADAREGMQAFLEKRSAKFEG